jgi:hypothetical protein
MTMVIEFYVLEWANQSLFALFQLNINANDEALEVKVRSGRRTKPKLLMYS